MFERFRGRRDSLAVISLSLAQLMTGLDPSIANTSLPDLARAYGASFASAQWIVLAYLLPLTALSVVAGRAGDLFGRRRVYLAGLGLFTASSLSSALAPSLSWLLAARAVQGACAAATLALGYALIGDLRHASAERTMGRLAAMSAIGTTVGPLAGSVAGHFGTGAIFLVNVPLGVLALVLAVRYLPAKAPCPRGPVSFDATSLLMSLKIFRNPALSVSLIASAIVATVVTATLIVGPFYLTHTLELERAQAGFLLSAGPAAAALTAAMAGRLIERFGSSRAAMSGLTVMATGGSLLALLPTSTATVGYLVPLVVMTSGYAVFQTANNTAALAEAGTSRRGVAGGLLTLSRNVGQIIGAAVLGSVFLHATGASALSTASPDAIARGMRTTLATATALVVTALALIAATRTTLSSASLNHSRLPNTERNSPC